jgi:hypothetical protein
MYYKNIQKQKNKKWPTQKFIFDNLWTNAKDAYKEHHDGYLETFVHVGLPKVVSDISGSAAFCEAYFKWLSQKLSEKGEVSLPEVEKELKFMLNIKK